MGKLDIVFHTSYSIEYKTQLNKQIIEYTSYPLKCLIYVLVVDFEKFITCILVTS